MRLNVLAVLTATVLLLDVAGAAEPRHMPLDRVLGELQSTFRLVAANAAGDHLPAPQSVDLALRVFLEEEAGQPRFMVVGQGAVLPEGRSQALKMKLSMPKDAKEAKAAAGDLPAGKPDGHLGVLAAALLEAASTVKQAREGKPAMKVDRLQVELPFVVKGDDRGPDIVALVPASLEPMTDSKRSEMQSMTVTFGKAE